MDNSNNYDGPMTSGLMGGNSVTPRESEMARVLSKLYQLIEVAGKQFSDLDSKLSPILRGPNPEGINNAKSPGYSSTLAQEISGACEKLDSLIGYIQSVKNRVEL